MSGYHLVLKIRRLEEECSNLGFMLCHPKYGTSDYDIVALKPKDKNLCQSMLVMLNHFVARLRN